MSRGLDRERDVVHLLESWGWLAIRAAGSLGLVDVVAIGGELARFEGAGSAAHVLGQEPPRWTLPVVLLVTVKSTAGGPYERFGPSERQQLIVEAAKHSAIPVLAYWPPASGRRKREALRWIWEHQWPRMKVRVR